MKIERLVETFSFRGTDRDRKRLEKIASAKGWRKGNVLRRIFTRGLEIEEKELNGENG